MLIIALFTPTISPEMPVCHHLPTIPAITKQAALLTPRHFVDVVTRNRDPKPLNVVTASTRPTEAPEVTEVIGTEGACAC
jgi:hypothetical protein